MNEHEHRLREAFESHEHLAPSLGAVYNGSQVLFRRYLRRRRGAQVVSGAVLGAGLIAGGTHLPAGLLPGATIAVPPARVGTATPPVPVPSTTAPLPATGSGAPAPADIADLELEADAFDNAGYGHEDAVRLAELWHTPGDLLAVKARAGRQLLAGRTLPIQPAAYPHSRATVSSDEKAKVAFFHAGYSYEDAVRLAQLWKLPGPAEAKIAGGTELEAGRSLPFAP